ncbi:SGNH/GDSL hydrolase family protein [Aeromicrobium terrae]|uniref:SGNH/GDSL hydrolase family protein n=1 Tax=Aeromicrobium terrae TaxID=2498846 RepID=A0A5C8NJT9_9ACTN|nr:SGNH/GDSL hydrolase family protein [Aeromicrobium terrae]TXL62029.1 SGNH/GDSL hydrolase family protein [Aeromicrobium terrae]
MSLSRTAIRAALVIAVTAGLLAIWQSARGGETPTLAPAVKHGTSTTLTRLYPNGIVVVGDSITARYNDEPGDAEQGWWSIVGRHFGAHVTTYAQSGSGYLRQGKQCSGDRFIDRPQAFRHTAPSLFIVEGGRNDWSICLEGQHVPATDQQIAEAVDHYLDVLQRQLPRSTRIVVLGPPWGPESPWDGKRVTSIVHTAAQRHGLKYVSTTGTLDDPARVVDGVHPNRDGSTALAERVISALS